MKIKTFNEKFMSKEQKSEFRQTPTWNGECVDDYIGSNDYLIDLVYDDNDNLIAIYDHNWMNIITEKTQYVRSLVEVPVLDWIPIERNNDEEEEEENYWN